MYPFESVLLRWLRLSLYPKSESVTLSSEEVNIIEEVFHLAMRQGVGGVIVPSIEQTLASPESNFCHQLDSQGFNVVSGRILDYIHHRMSQRRHYLNQMARVARYAEALHVKGITMYILKGIAYSTYYSEPTMRECGDCDCYLLSESLPLCSISYDILSISDAYKVGLETIKELGGTYDEGTSKHSHMFLHGLVIENHRYLSDFQNSEVCQRIEILLRQRLLERPGTRIRNSWMICPNAHFNALFFLRHAMEHFFFSGLSLRMLYDWAALIKAEQNHLQWQIIFQELEDCHMRSFADLITAVCIRYLGTQPNEELSRYLSPVQPSRVERLMKETLRHDYSIPHDESFLHKCHRVLYRFVHQYRYRDLAFNPYYKTILLQFINCSYLQKNKKNSHC